MTAADNPQSSGYIAARLELIRWFRSLSLAERFTAVEDMIELSDAIIAERYRKGKKSLSGLERPDSNIK